MTVSRMILRQYHWDIVGYPQLWTNENALDAVVPLAVDIYACCPDGGQTALHMAVKSMNEKAVFTLLKKGLDVTRLDYGGESQLTVAVGFMARNNCGYPCISAVLAACSSRKLVGQNIMCPAVETGNAAFVSQISDTLAESDEEVKAGLSPLLYAVSGTRP